MSFAFLIETQKIFIIYTLHPPPSNEAKEKYTFLHFLMQTFFGNSPGSTVL